MSYPTGMKLVYIGGCVNHLINEPEIGEIVTSDGRPPIYGDRCTIIREYPISKNRKAQYCEDNLLKPLDQWLKEQSETDIKEIEKTFPELVPIKI